MAKKKKKASRKSSRSSKKSADALTKSALRLIDQAAVLMKAGVIAGAKQGAKSRIVLKRKANALAGIAIKRLNKAVQQGGSLIRKGIKKL